MLGKASKSGHDAPKCEREDEPDASVTIVSKESHKDPGQYIEIVEDRACYDIIQNTTPTVIPLTNLICCSIIIKCDSITECLIMPENREGGGREKERERKRERRKKQYHMNSVGKLAQHVQSKLHLILLTSLIQQ